MKIALVISSLWRGGAERVMSLLANHLASRGHSVVLVTYERSSSDYALDSRVQRISLDLHGPSRGFFHSILSNVRRLAALRQALCSAKPAVVVSFEERMNAFVLLVTLGQRARTIISERTDPRRHEVGLFWRALRRATYPLADALVVQTEAVRPWAERAVCGKSRVYVLPNPVRSMQPYVRSTSGDNATVIVAVGRLEHGKGFDLLLRAAASLAPAHTRWRLIVVGEGPERHRLERLAIDLGVQDRLTITGWMSEPGEMLALADIYVLPSRYEGFPNALLEALACGLPVVASACAGAAEILTHEVDGLLVPVESVPALASAIGRLMKDADLRVSLSAAALATAERYRIDTVGRRWEQVFAALACSAAPGFAAPRFK